MVNKLKVGDLVVIVFGISLDNPLDLQEQLLVQVTQCALRLFLTQILEQEKHVVVCLTINVAYGAILGSSHSVSLVAVGERRAMLLALLQNGVAVADHVAFSIACVLCRLLLIFDVQRVMVR